MGETEDCEWDDRKHEATLAKRNLALFTAARIFDGRPRFDVCPEVRS